MIEGQTAAMSEDSVELPEWTGDLETDVIAAIRTVFDPEIPVNVYDLGLIYRLAPLAFIFDVLDGRIARWRHAHSALGRELDSLADIISFGVGPATLAFAAGMRGGWDLAVLIYFVCCGVSRLARFNVTAETLSAGSDKVKFFEGTPIPTSVLLTAVLTWCAWQGRIGEQLFGGAWTVGPATLHPLVLLFALSGSLMISKTLRIPKF